MTRVRRRAGAVLLVALAAASGWAQHPTRTHLARVELVGPLERVELDLPDGGGATLDLALAEGERRTLSVPLATPAAAPQAVPDVVAAGGGSARFAGWVPSDAERLDQDWERLPPGLRLRPKPPAPESRGVEDPPLAAVLLACAGFLLVLRWRARGLTALGIGTLAAGVVFAVASRPAPAGTVLRLLEGDGASGRWIAVRAARERLTVLPAEALWVETRPARATLRVRVLARDGELLWQLEAPRATLYQTEILEVGPALVPRTGPNRLGTLGEVWVREGDGKWTRRGRWELGEPLPPPQAAPESPPGWINPALPMGSAILVGVLDRASPSASAPGEPHVETWVRVVGF